MRSKADKTLVIVETLICPLQISLLLILQVRFFYQFFHYLWDIITQVEIFVYYRYSKTVCIQRGKGTSERPQNTVFKMV